MTLSSRELDELLQHLAVNLRTPPHCRCPAKHLQQALVDACILLYWMLTRAAVSHCITLHLGWQLALASP